MTQQLQVATRSAQHPTLLSLSSPFWTMPTEQPTAAADDGLPRDADGNKIKPCCACPETRKPRDEWQVRWQWQHLLPRSKVSPSPCPSLPLPPRQYHGEGRAGVCRPHRGAQGGFWGREPAARCLLHALHLASLCTNQPSGLLCGSVGSAARRSGPVRWRLQHLRGLHPCPAPTTGRAFVRWHPARCGRRRE